MDHDQVALPFGPKPPSAVVLTWRHTTGAAIVNSTIDLAHALGLDIPAPAIAQVVADLVPGASRPVATNFTNADVTAVGT